MLKLPGFEWMKSLVPTHIPHDLSDVMQQKSDIFLLPVQLKNEASYADCIGIMDECVATLNRLYTKSGRAADLDEIHVPFGGDQLTRVRLQGAKSLRAGAHTRAERFEKLDPIIVELFHTLMDFLEKTCKKFLNLQNGRDARTLSNIKVFIQRDNVNGNVKSRYKAHEDFVITCGRGYLQTYMLHHFKMNQPTDHPVHPKLQPTVKHLKNDLKRPVYTEIMDEIIREIFIPFEMQETTNVKVTIGNTAQVQHVKASVHDDGPIHVPVEISGSKFVVTTSKDRLNVGYLILLHNCTMIKIENATSVSDELNNYVTNFLQWFFVIIQLKDAIHEGDIKRINIILKQMIPFFYSHSALSKYMTECIDYILKTEHLLSEQLSLRVRAASVVNPQGGVGQNKAADMQKENQVKFLKDLIKGLGANKTEKAIVDITTAAEFIQDISDNFERLLGIKSVKTNHEVKDSADDLKAIVTKLQQLDIWSRKVRTLKQKVSRSPFDFDRKSFNETVSSVVARLMRELPFDGKDSSGEDVSDTD